MIRPTSLALFSVLLGAAWDGPLAASTVFAVTADEVEQCNRLGQTVAALAAKRREGASEQELRQAIRAPGVSSHSVAAVEALVFGIDAKDPGQMQGIAGALCLMDKLKPMDAR
jgi:type II secretory pathway component PulJ